MTEVIAGIGCRRDCSAADISAALRTACVQAGRRAGLLAAPAFKSSEQGLLEAAAQIGLPLIFITTDALHAAQAKCATVSRVVSNAVGIGSVAEGCALAASGVGGRLILARISHGGATCALAEVA